MWRVIVGTICVLSVLIGSWVVFFAFGARMHETTVTKDDMAGLRGKGMLKEANVILDGLVNPTSIEGVSYLDTGTRARVLAWLSRYNQTFTKGKK